MSQQRQKQLRNMVNFAESHCCRMNRLITHFGDQDNFGPNCGLCDFCNPKTFSAVVGTPKTKLRKKVQSHNSKQKKKTKYAYSEIKNENLFIQLKEWRLKIAKSKNIPAFRILTDRVLMQICEDLPRSEKELNRIHGMGPKSIELYGHQLIDLVKK